MKDQKQHDQFSLFIIFNKVNFNLFQLKKWHITCGITVKIMFKLNEIQCHNFLELQIGFWFATMHFCFISYLKSVAVNSLLCATESLWMTKNLFCWSIYFFSLGSMLKEIGDSFCCGWSPEGNVLNFWENFRFLEMRERGSCCCFYCCELNCLEISL